MSKIISTIRSHVLGLIKRPLCWVRIRTHVYKFITLSPKDYYLILGVNTIKLVELDQMTYTPIYDIVTKRLLFNPRQQYHKTRVYLYFINQKSPRVNHFKFWFWSDILQVHRSTSNKMDFSPDIDPTEISRIFHQLP